MDENSPEQLFNKEQEKLHKLGNIPGLKPKEGQGAASIDEQRILSQVQAALPPAPVAVSQGECPQCGLIHPPLQPGEKCPNAPLESKDGVKIDITGLVIKVKDILSSQLEQKNIKDLDKFTGEMVVALMKFCEEYKE